jgi:hypothetical protein
MWDGSAVSMKENLAVADEMLDKCAAARTILEIEIGVVGGEEDGVEASHDAKLFSTPEDALAMTDRLGLGERGRYLVAATFGNVHGVYKPGNVVLTPGILKELQDAVQAKHNTKDQRENMKSDSSNEFNPTPKQQWAQKTTVTSTVEKVIAPDPYQQSKANTSPQSN